MAKRVQIVTAELKKQQPVQKAEKNVRSIAQARAEHLVLVAEQKDGYCTEINYHLSLVEFKIINKGTGNVVNNTDRVFRDNDVYKISSRRIQKY